LIKEIVAGSSFNFPVGKNGVSGELSVNNTLGFAGTPEWTVEYFSNNPNDDGYDPTDINQVAEEIEIVSEREYWKVNGPASGEADITLRWDSSISGVPADPADLVDYRVMEGDASTFAGWTNVGGTDHGASTTFGTVTSVNGAGTSGRVTFSEKVFTLGAVSPEIPLPVELLSFNANEIEFEVILNWITASELNNDYFEVERSVDGLEFTVIGEISGYGTTTEAQQYEFIDSNPEYGINYYRLRQVDFDGQYAYSWIVKAIVNELGEEDFNVTLYPNPTKSNDINLRIRSIDRHSDYYVVLRSLTGTIIWKSKYQSNGNSMSLVLIPGELKTGVYLLQVQQGDYHDVKRLIIY